jgi:hypothetical protein
LLKDWIASLKAAASILEECLWQAHDRWSISSFPLATFDELCRCARKHCDWLCTKWGPGGA